MQENNNKTNYNNSSAMPRKWCCTCGRAIPEPTSAAESIYCESCRNWWYDDINSLVELRNVVEAIRERAEKQKKARSKRWQKRRNKINKQEIKYV